MADIRCSRCGHFAFPSGLSKEYKKWGGEVLCDSCYADLMREIESLPEEARKAKEEAELAAIKAKERAGGQRPALYRPQQRAEHCRHGLKGICDHQCDRGRHSRFFCEL